MAGDLAVFDVPGMFGAFDDLDCTLEVCISSGYVYPMSDRDNQRVSSTTESKRTSFSV